MFDPIKKIWSGELDFVAYVHIVASFSIYCHECFSLNKIWPKKDVKIISRVEIHFLPETVICLPRHGNIS